MYKPGLKTHKTRTMKHFLFTLCAGLLMSIGVHAGEPPAPELMAEVPTTYVVAAEPADVITFGDIFVSLVALIVLTPLVTQLLRKILMPLQAGHTVQVLSWFVAIILTLLLRLCSLGLLDELLWWQALIYGFSLGLAANGIYDSGVFARLMELLGLKLPMVRK
jgi:hypothetical protein